MVVPVGGAAPAWIRCAASLARLDPPPAETVVVLDGPNAAAARCAADIGARVVALGERGGPARARNRGAAATRQAVLLFLDADVEVPADLVSRVAASFAAHPEAVALFGSYDDAPADPGFLSQYRNLLHHHVHQTASGAASTFWAGCGAIRRWAFEEVGGFDERFAEPSIEDIELGVRLRRAGHVIRLVKDLQVRHLKRWRAGDMLATDLWRRAVPWTALMLRDGRITNDLNVKTGDRVSVALAFVTLAAAAAAWRWPALLAVAAAATVLALVLNARLFGFFRRRRGALFALRAMPVYWAYLLICGLGFGLGVVRHLLGRRP